LRISASETIEDIVRIMHFLDEKYGNIQGDKGGRESVTDKFLT